MKVTLSIQEHKSGGNYFITVEGVDDRGRASTVAISHVAWPTILKWLAVHGEAAMKGERQQEMLDDAEHQQKGASA